MKNKKVKIGAIIIGLMLGVIILGGFMLKSGGKSLTVKPEIEKNNDLIVDKTTEGNSSKEGSEVSNKKSEEDEKATSRDEVLKDEKDVSENKNDTSLNTDNTDENKQESKPGVNEDNSKAPIENKPETSGDSVQNPSEGSKPETKPEIRPEPVSKYVTISITCNTILNNLDKVPENKKDIIPSNGVILAEKQVEINDGDTVFDVLLRETRKQRIHMDFVESPVYGSTYIKGINNLYEFDGGDLSGWMYSVNGVFPNYGCSNYNLNDGDIIQWKYTCDLGRDL